METSALAQKERGQETVYLSCPLCHLCGGMVRLGFYAALLCRLFPSSA